MKVKFYVATLAAAVDRANKVAPNKGVAFDKAAGIVLDVDPEAPSVYLRATNLDVYYREEVKDVVDYGDTKLSWRLPSHLFSGIVGNFPLGKEATFEQTSENEVTLRCGRRKAKLRTMPVDIYPQWDHFPKDGMLPVPGFASAIPQVAWAVDATSVPFTGVNIDGSHLNATDRYRLARVPCEVPIDRAVTAPMAIIANILRNLPGEVFLKAEGEHLYLRVGDEIQVMSTIFEKAYPDITKVLRDDFTLDVKVHRQSLYDSIASMLVLVKSERYPRMNFDFEEGAIAMFMTVPGVGDMMDSIEAEFDSEETFSITFSPEFVIKALEVGTSEFVHWSLGPSPEQMSRIKDGDYVAYIMPMATT